MFLHYYIGLLLQSLHLHLFNLLNRVHFIVKLRSTFEYHRKVSSAYMLQLLEVINPERLRLRRFNLNRSRLAGQLVLFEVFSLAVHIAIVHFFAAGADHQV